MNNSLKPFLLLFLFGLIGCSGPMDYSVTEPIPIKELKSVIDKDTLFELTYKIAERIREAKLTDDIEKAKWSNITYKNVHDVVLLYSDSTLQNKYFPKIKNEWKSKFSSDLRKADSIVDYWKEYIENNSIHNYVKVELFDVQDSKVGLRITPLNGTIDDIKIYYSFIKKGDKDEISSFERHPSIYKRKSSFYALPRTNKAKIVWHRDREFRNILDNKLLEDILDKYEFKFKIRSITVNGIYEIADLLIKDVPFTVKWMIENESSILSETYREDIIREYISTDFIRYDKYKLVKIDSIANIYAPDVLKFLNLLNED